VRVDATRDQVKNAPSIEGDEQLSETDERKLFEYYNMPYTDEGSVTAEGAPRTAANGGTTAHDVQAGATGHDTSGPNTDDAMTRSEEELRVGKTTQERGRARLRKYIVTEQVQTTIPVQREEVRVEREPITDANIEQALDGPGLSEEEHEVVLHEEQPVVEKRTVPKERVALRRDAVTDEQQISEQVRKEQIESEGDHL
jgi:uncharacterized protein (TIGR02271 family)